MFCKVAFDVPLDRDFDYAVPPELASAVRPGLRVTAPFGRLLTCGIITQVTEVSGAPEGMALKEIAALMDQRPLFGSDLFPLARFIKQQWGGPLGQILFSLVPPQPYFKLDNAPIQLHMALKQPSYTLTADQEKALHLLRNVDPYEFHALLLSGPAYTGKTEVILRHAADVFSTYGQVLLTVPDISSARQFISEAQTRFGSENVFCWHSRTLLSQKKKIFSAVSNGVPCVIISTRSGALLPFKNLRFAAVLDEGDDNYKQEENKPYYHLRDVLMFRARMHGATLLFASSTPSAEMVYQVQQHQIDEIRFTRPLRHFSPQIKITGKKGSRSRLISDELISALDENLKRKEMSLLILNRRGYANSYFCLNCGTYAKCKKCGAILVHEKSAEKGEYLLCKKCGQKEPLEQECPKCHNLIFKSRGGGTQKIAAELTKIFPQAKLLRLESDTLKTKAGQGFEALHALQNGQADIIIGTRLAAGALRGARITLAGLLDADLELNTPDFRATEKFSRLLFDLYGHLSGMEHGRLLIQTADSQAYDYAPLQAGNYGEAMETELALRESFLYPPFVHLFRMTLKSKNEALLKSETLRLRRLAAPVCTAVLGPVWCTKKTDTLKKQYLLFKTDAARRADLLAVLDRFVPAKKVTVKLAADPYDFY